MKASIFRKAAKEVTINKKDKGYEFCCIELDEMQGYSEREFFKKHFSPKKFQLGTWTMGDLTKENSLRRSIALLLAAEMIENNDY